MKNLQPKELYGYRRIQLGEMLGKGDIFFTKDGMRCDTFDYGSRLTNGEYTYFRPTNTPLEELRKEVKDLKARIEKLETAPPAVREIHYYPVPIVPQLQWPAPITPYFSDPIRIGPTCSGSQLSCFEQQKAAAGAGAQPGRLAR